MALLNFQPRFVPFIMNGSKGHTIRAERAIPIKVGEILHLYTGLRHKGAKLLMRVPCVKVENILITPGGVIRINGEYLQDDEREQLAKRDGFKDFQEMITFWREPKNRLPFKGNIIYWKARQ